VRSQNCGIADGFYSANDVYKGIIVLNDSSVILVWLSILFLNTVNGRNLKTPV